MLTSAKRSRGAESRTIFGCLPATQRRESELSAKKLGKLELGSLHQSVSFSFPPLVDPIARIKSILPVMLVEISRNSPITNLATRRPSQPYRHAHRNPSIHKHQHTVLKWSGSWQATSYHKSEVQYVYYAARLVALFILQISINSARLH